MTLSTTLCYYIHIEIYMDTYSQKKIVIEHRGE